MLRVPGDHGGRSPPRIEIYLEQPYRRTMPAFDRLLAGDDGMILVRRYLAAGDANQEWLILDPSGEPRGRLELPLQVSLRRTVTDYLLGIYRDELDIQYARMYRISSR